MLRNAKMIVLDRQRFRLLTERCAASQMPHTSETARALKSTARLRDDVVEADEALRERRQPVRGDTGSEVFWLRALPARAPS